MPLRTNQLQALYARRREAEHNRVERTAQVNKYFDHWGKVTARFDSWTRPDYYKQAEQQLENVKKKKEKQKHLAERQQKLAELLETEKRNYKQEMRLKENCKFSRRTVDTPTLEKIEKNLKEQQELRRKLELEAKLYGKWRHGVEDENLLFESKSDNEVLAKLNWLDKQVDQQIQREKEEEAAKERQLKFQQELNKSEELQKERQQIREKEIREIRGMQEYHMEQLKERQKETDELIRKEKQMKDNLSELNKELELLEESYKTLRHPADFSDAYNLNKIKLFIRKRSQVFRNQINICTGILERTMDYTERPEVLNNFKKRLEQQMQNEIEKFAQIEAMYESEAKYSLQRSEEVWQQQHTERYKELKQLLTEELHSINNSLGEILKKQDELLEIRETHLSAVENSSEKLKLLIQEEENSPRYQKSEDSQSLNETKRDNFSPRYQIKNNIIHSQLEESANTPLNLSQRAFDSKTSLETKRVHFSPRYETKNNIIHSQLEESADTPLNSPHHDAADKSKLSLELEEPSSPVDFPSRRNCYESNDTTLSPRMASSFRNLNLDVCESDTGHCSQRELESRKSYSQRSLQVVTSQTEADRPRFGRKRVAWT